MKMAILLHLAAAAILLLIAPRCAAATWVGSIAWAVTIYVITILPTVIARDQSPGFLDDDQWELAIVIYARSTFAMLALSILCTRGDVTSLWWTPVLFPIAAMTAVVSRSIHRLFNKTSKTKGVSR